MKRRVTLILLLLLGGAIINIAVAWGCAVVFDLSYENIGDNTHVDIPAELLEPFVANGFLPCDDVHWVVGSSSALHDFVYLATSCFTCFNAAGDFANSERTRVHCDTFLKRTGVPLRSFAGMVNQMTELKNYPISRDNSLLTGTQTTTTSYRAIVFSRPKQLGGDLRFMPAGIIWPGFAINTLFYAALLWMIFVFPFALRRRLRIQRGLCPACAYPAGTSPICTECGAAVSKPSSPEGAKECVARRQPDSLDACGGGGRSSARRRSSLDFGRIGSDLND